MAEMDNCVERKIPKLLDEGMSQEQAVAAAHSMCEEDHKTETKMVMRPTQMEVGYVTLSTEAGKACANCRFFDGDVGMCALIENYPESVLATGYCARHEAPPSMETHMEDMPPMPAVVVEDTAALTPPEPAPPPESKSVRQQVHEYLEEFMGALLGRKEPQLVAFKVIGDHWFARWSNTFKDRDDEYFATKAHDDYILRTKMGVTPMPELWVDHIHGSKHGAARMVARIGHFMIAAGTFDETPMGKAAKAYYGRHAAKGVSHGFAFDKTQLIDGVYHQYNTFEISPLMRKTPANPFTTFDEVRNMKLTEQDIKLLNDMFGEEIVKSEIIAKTEQASKVLEEAGVAYKDFIDPQPATQPAAVEAVKSVEKDFAGLILQLIEGHADSVTIVDAMGKAIKARDEATNKIVEGLKADLATLQKEFDLRPRVASKDDETVADESKINADIVKDMHQTKADPFWNPAG